MSKRLSKLSTSITVSQLIITKRTRINTMGIILKNSPDPMQLDALFSSATGRAIESESEINELWNELIKLPNVIVLDEEMHLLQYNQKTDVKTKDELLKYIRKCPHGIPLPDLQGMYPKVKTDMDQLIEDMECYKIDHDPVGSSSSQKFVIFPRLREFEVPVDDEIKQLWHNVKMPPELYQLDEITLFDELQREEQGKMYKSSLSPKEIAEKQADMARTAQQKAKEAAQKKTREQLKLKRVQNEQQQQQQDQQNVSLNVHSNTFTNAHLIGVKGYEWLTEKDNKRIKVI